MKEFLKTTLLAFALMAGVGIGIGLIYLIVMGIGWLIYNVGAWVLYGIPVLVVFILCYAFAVIIRS